MPGYWRFFRGESSLLTYGVVLAFFSSFGQTFFISLFVPSWLRDFGVGAGAFGTVYALATLGSAFLLPWAGAWLDRIRLTRFSLLVVTLMAGSAFLMASAGHLVTLFLALLGLRLAGQGLSAQTAFTTMARYYTARRGAALSISSLGFPMGEAVLPLLLAGSIAWLGWRGSWMAVGGLALFVFAPLLIRLLVRSGAELDPLLLGAPSPRGPGPGPGGSWEPLGPGPRSWRRGEVLRDPRLWALLPTALMSPFWGTGLFLYQTAIAGLKGWSLPLMASAFVAYAVARTACALLAGGAVDRLSAARVFPFSGLPLAAGFLVLAGFDGVWAAYAFMACVGVTTGVVGTVKPALWAELYGVGHLGAIKSAMASIMVVSTAASPVLVGFWLDRGWGLEGLLLGGVGSVLVGMALALRTLPR